jgi:hypothetical protein
MLFETLRMQKRERQPKDMMRFRGQFVPILYGRSRKDIFGSEGWVAQGTLQRVGAIIFAVVFFCSAIALPFAAILARSEISQGTGGAWGQVFGIGLGVLAFLVAFAAMLLSFRLVRGIVRSFYK